LFSLHHAGIGPNDLAGPHCLTVEQHLDNARAFAGTDSSAEMFVITMLLMNDLEAAWDELHTANEPLHWFIGPTTFEERLEVPWGL
jgi:hypothetical protein